MADVLRPAIRTSLLEGGSVLLIVLDQPRANILSMAMMSEIQDALSSYREAKALKLVVLRGAGGNFSFGASVAEHRPEIAPAMLAAFHDLVRDVASFPVPVASLVEGRCLGGAFELVLASHLVMAANSAVFACPEIKLGVIPPVLAVLGHHRLGGALAERMMLTGCEIDAAQARACGLATLLPSGPDPLELLLRWYSETLAPLSAFALREATWAARHSSGVLASLGSPLDLVEARYLDRLLASHDANEGIAAFLAKRPPVWVDA